MLYSFSLAHGLFDIIDGEAYMTYTADSLLGSSHVIHLYKQGSPQ